MRVPMITAREWRSIAPLLPPTGGPGKPRQDDRRIVSAFFYSEATRSSLDSLPLAYGNARSLRTRRQRWTVDGTSPRLMKAGEPVIQRMRRAYWALIRDATLDSKNSRFGKGVIPRQPHMEPRGRYADRRRGFKARLGRLKLFHAALAH
jgi:transposase